MSKEVEEAIERVEDTIYNHSGYGINHFKKITFYEDGIEDIKKLLNYIKELEETLKCTQNSWYSDTEKIQELIEENNGYKQYIKRLYKLNRRYFIPKQVIRDKIEEIKLNIKESKDVLYGAENIVSVLKELLEEE